MYLEKVGVPTSTVVSTAFLKHGHLAAKNLQMEALPLLVTPHPLNDLTPEQVRELAQAAYPIVIEQLTGMGEQAPRELERAALRAEVLAGET